MSSKKLKAETVFLGKYNSKKKLGKGAFGDVYLVEQSGQQHALKIIDKKKMLGENQHLLEYLQGQIQVMKAMDTKYIVELRDFLEDDDYYYIVLEYCNGGDLLNMQAAQPNRVFTLQSATEYLSQVILGLEVLHKQGYLHRDIKPQNVLVKNEGNTKIFKIADFGFSKKAKNVNGTVLGTEQFMSPQIYRAGLNDQEQDSYGFEVDMWAFGVLFFNMLNQSYPFQINPYWTIEVKYNKLCEFAKDFSYKKAVANTRKKCIQNCTQQMQDLFRKIFRIDTAKRISFSQIRQHPVFSKHFPKPSPESQILYKTKFKSSFLAKGKLKNNLAEKAKQLSNATNSDFKLLSMLCVQQKEETFDEEKKILKLEIQEINFLYEMVEEIQAVEKNIGLMQTLMFAFNLIKYNIVLSNKFISNLTHQHYNKKYKGLKWSIFFSEDESRQLKKQFTRSMAKSQAKYQDLYFKCNQNLKQLSSLNNSFSSAFNEEIIEDDFNGDFYRSYRKSTDIIYQTLKEYLKTKKELKFYYFLCMNCICHVFSDLVDNQQLKFSLFKQIIEARQVSKDPKISYRKLSHYLKSSDKNILLRLAKKIIEQVMS